MTKDSKTNAVKCILTLLDFTVITSVTFCLVVMSTPENGSMPFFMRLYKPVGCKQKQESTST